MPKRTLYASFLLLIVAALPPAAAHAGQGTLGAPVPCAACLIFVLSPGESLLLPDALNGLEVLVRTAPRDAAAAPPHPRGAVRAALQAVEEAGGRPGLFVTGIGAPPPDGDGAALARRVVLQLPAAAAVDPQLVFDLKNALTEWRALAPEAALGVAAGSAVIGGLLKADLGPYVDFMVQPAAGAPPFEAAAGGRAIGVVRGVEGSALQPAAGGARWILELPEDVPLGSRLLEDVARAAPFLGVELIAGGTVEVRCGGVPAATYLDPATLDTIAVVRGCGDGRIAMAPDVEPTARVRLSAGDVLLRVPSIEGGYAEDLQVVGARRLTAREVVARHQAAAARQARDVRHLISSGSMTLTFEAPGFPAPMAITAETVIFRAPDRVEIEQREIRVNGVAFQPGGVPRLPLLEPERVASPPLAISLAELYAYRLAGEEAIDGVRCYVLAFEPLDRARSLFAGRAWIAADSFAMVRVSAVQTALRGPIVSSEQTDTFRPVHGFWLLARSEVRQIYEGAGHRTPIHRVLAIAHHEINPPAFEARRRAAYASNSVILRDTPEGFRYLQREPGVPLEAGEVPPVTGPATRVRTFAAGVVIDPNITRPLPFAGLSYVDFDLFGTGAQVNAFFGGTYGQLAVSVPSLGGTRWQLAGRAFGIASSYHDRLFVEGREAYERNIVQRPAHASVALVRPITPRVAMRMGYDFDYTHFDRASSTARAFVVPAAQLAHGLRAGVDAQWGGWTATAWWLGVRRDGWRAWGIDPSAVAPPDGYHARHADYQRGGVGLGRSWIASPRLVGRVDATLMGGRDLDRFSRYTFGSFENRLRGYPAALVRYDRGVVVRGAAAWAAGRFLRLDGFLDSALVRDPGFGRRARSFTGIGAAAEAPAPFGLLLAVEWGYGFQGVNAGGSRGTHVVRISGYKMF